ncbi:hypothetical protein QJQ45_003248 [Haematococcus lacustris]|nr:hypothetical protein QJQ45_003248 [Haematococcus lacustris]
MPASDAYKAPFPTLAELSPASGACGPVYRCEYSPKDDPTLGGITNLAENFAVAVEKFSSRPCLGFRRPGPDGAAGPYEFLSYTEVGALVAAAHAGYQATGLGPGDKLGVIGLNCVEWMVALQGINRMNGCCVPLYDTLGDSAVQYVVKHSEAKMVLAQGSKLPLVVKAVAGLGAAQLSAGVVYWGEGPQEAVKALETAGLRVQRWEELLAAGRAAPVAAQRVTPEDLCTIMYTSGTTGDPKGVMLTHRAVVATIAGVQAFLRKAKEALGPSDVFLSYLTLAHILDRVVEEFMLHVGGSIGYFQGDIRKIMADIDALKPTLFAGVPRVFERIYSGVQDQPDTSPHTLWGQPVVTVMRGWSAAAAAAAVCGLWSCMAPVVVLAPPQLKKGGAVKNMVFNLAYYRKLYYIKAGYRHDKVKGQGQGQGQAGWLPGPGPEPGWLRHCKSLRPAHKQLELGVAAAAAGRATWTAAKVSHHQVQQHALDEELEQQQQGRAREGASIVSDLLVFNKIKNKLGGRVRVILTGGAPLSPQIEEFLRVTMCAPVVQGYGLTETCAASFISYPYAIDQAGTVGPPMPHTELRLEAVPEMGYDPLGSPPRGEVCIRSKAQFQGYYKNAELTQEAVDADGFFHTGDIGELEPSGALKIIDRKKNLFKLSHGEYIAVERIENVYKNCPLVEMLWVYGNSFESCLVAVVVPKEDALRKLAADKGVEGADAMPLKELCRKDAMVAAVLGELKAEGKSAKLKGFEEIKAVLLETVPFSPENDLMTPSFKLKRAPLLKHYQPAIKAMYDKVRAAGGAGA